LRALADVDLEALPAAGDRHPLVSELTYNVEGLAQRLFEREPQGVCCDRALDLRADVCGCLEEAIRGHEPVERLMRPLEVVVGQVVHEPLLRIDGVREDRTSEKLVPQRLPEALDLAECLRMLRPTADVMNAHPPQCLFELGLAAPHRVLPPVVGQHLDWLSVARDAVLEGLHHEGRPLVMRECVSHDEAAVVVHEHAHVQSLCPSQPKREDVRLPQLIRRRPLEAPRLVLPCRRRLRCLDQTLVVEDLSDLLLRHPDGFEAREHVTDAPRAPRLVFTLERHHVVADDRVRRTFGPRSTPLRLQRCRPTLAKCRRPLLHRRHRNAEGRRHLLVRRALHPLLDDQQLVLGRDLAATSSLSLLVRHPVSCSADSRQRFGENSAR
jgi:hypothetical protein